MLLRRITSIKAGCEKKKRKFVSSRLRQAECNAHPGCTAPLAMTRKKIRQGKQIIVSQLRAVIRQSASSNARA
jgi:hypothetical protein